MYENLMGTLDRIYDMGCRAPKDASKESSNVILCYTDASIYSTIKEWADNNSKGINLIKWDVSKWAIEDLSKKIKAIRVLKNTVIFVEGMDAIKDETVYEALRGLVKERFCLGEHFYSLPMTIIRKTNDICFDNGLKSACSIFDCREISLNGNKYTALSVKTVNKRLIRCFDITQASINDVEAEISNHPSYGTDDILIDGVLKQYQYNTDINIVAMKIALIDVTNSTHLSQHKSKVSIYKLAKRIVDIKDFDCRVKRGDLTLVKDIIDFGGDINLFSFASKYCNLHNRHLYNGDAYPKYDGIVATSLPIYFEQFKVNSISFTLNGKKYEFDQLTSTHLNNIRKEMDYPAFVKIIDCLIDKLGLSNEPNIKAKLDHFIWYTNR